MAEKVHPSGHVSTQITRVRPKQPGRGAGDRHRAGLARFCL